MTTRFFKQASLILAVAATTMVPAAGYAASKGMDVCVAAFKERLPEGHPVRVVIREPFRVPLTSLRSDATIVLKARGSRTGEVFGEAKCVVDRKGELVAMQFQNSSIRVAKTGRNEAAGG